MNKSLSFVRQTYSVYPFDVALKHLTLKSVEPLATVHVLGGWDALDSLSIDQRAMLMTKAENLFLGKNALESKSRETVLSLQLALDSSAEDAMSELLSLGGVVDAKSGCEVSFWGSSYDEPVGLAQGWRAESPPSKSKLIAAVKRLLRKSPKNEHDDWKANIEELEIWLAKIPESGIKISKRTIFEFPDKAGRQTDDERQEDEKEARLVIRIVAKKTTAFTGSMPNDEPSEAGNQAPTPARNLKDDKK